jgi:uncharacterized protein
MKNHLLSALLWCLLTPAFAQFTTSKSIRYAASVGDSFEVYLSLPQQTTPNERYKVIYYCDANLKSGKMLRSLLDEPEIQASLRGVMLVGIGHIGKHRVLRRRDFILPFIHGTDTSGRDKKYGQTEHFYRFLQQELIPDMQAQYPIDPAQNTILGHSLGGLFAFYCMFKNEGLFKNYVALSPALWIDKYNIYRFNKILTGPSAPGYLYFSAGSQEWSNRILHGTNQMNAFLEQKTYKNLSYKYDVWYGKTHNSQVPFSLRVVLKELYH